MKKKLIIIGIIVLVIINVAVGTILILNDKKDKYEVLSLHEIMNQDFTVTEKVKSLEGKKVALTGFIAVQSPVSEKFAYLVSMPYISCPYCSPDTNMLMSVMPIISSSAVPKIHYTSNSVIVKGTLEIADKTDEFGYTSPYRVVADSVEVYDKSNYSKELQDYIKVSSSGNVDAATYYMYNFYYMLYNKLDGMQGAVIEKLQITEMNKAINKLKSYKIDSINSMIDTLQKAYDLIDEFNKIQDVSSLGSDILTQYKDKIYSYMQEYFDFCKKVSI